MPTQRTYRVTRARIPSRKPEQHGRRWRVRVYGLDGRCRAPGFETREEAEAFARETRRQVEVGEALRRAADLQRQADEALAHAMALQGRVVTVGQAVEEFELALKARGLRDSSVQTKIYKMRGLCGILFDKPMASVTAQMAQATYQRRAESVAVSTHRAELKVTRELWALGGAKGWAPVNPWRDVKPLGRVESGKEQLRLVEARKLHETLLAALASSNTIVRRGAIGTGIALYLGFRASEIVNIQVHDVVPDGTYIEIPKSKTKKGERRMHVPDFLAAPLATLCAEREKLHGGRTRVMPFDRGWVRIWAHRFCDMAGVPRVCAHTLRGMHGSLSMEGGATAEAVARALGHTSTVVTLKHYVAPEAHHTAKTRATLRVLQGGQEAP